MSLETQHAVIDVGMDYSAEKMRILSTQVEWGELVAACGRHQCSRCEQCCFYGRPCKLQIETHRLDAPVLLVSQTGDDTEDSLKRLFGSRMLHRDSAVQEVVLGHKEDIDRFIVCGADARPQVANQIRAKHLALQIIKKKRLQCYLQRLVYPSLELSAIDKKLSTLRSQSSPDPDAPKIYWELRAESITKLEEERAQCLARWRERKERTQIYQPSLNPEERLAEVSEALSQLQEKATNDGLELPEIGSNQSHRRPDRAAIVFDDAYTAREAIQKFSQLDRLQRTWEREHLKVGLMTKEWKNWYSILFLQEILLERTADGPITSIVARLASLHFIGKLRKHQQGKFLLTMISTPHLLRQAIKRLRILAGTLEHFRVESEGGLRQVLDPKDVFQHGYMLEDSIDDRKADSIDVELSAVNSASSHEPVSAADIEHTIADKQVVEHVDALCGLCDATSLRAFLRRFYQPTACQARVTDPAGGPVAGNGSRLAQTMASSGPPDRMSILSAPGTGGGRRCFLSGTLLKSCGGQFWKVEELQIGNCVVSATGQRLQVMGHIVHGEASNLLVELRTDHEHVVVTGRHRVVTSLAPLQTALAQTLQRGQAVAISGGSVRELIYVRPFEQPSQVVEVLFTPDEPVETFPLPVNAVLTMGQRHRSPVRRSRMNQRRPRRNLVDEDVDDVLTFDPWR